ncbi:MAG: hypothetical protein FWE31_00960 [Firmicutes bacterium]|nr:hypothetical protein [Bacillota bacterium]
MSETLINSQGQANQVVKGVRVALIDDMARELASGIRDSIHCHVRALSLDEFVYSLSRNEYARVPREFDLVFFDATYMTKKDGLATEQWKGVVEVHPEFTDNAKVIVSKDMEYRAGDILDQSKVVYINKIDAMVEVIAGKAEELGFPVIRNFTNEKGGGHNSYEVRKLIKMAQEKTSGIHGLLQELGDIYAEIAQHSPRNMTESKTQKYMAEHADVAGTIQHLLGQHSDFYSSILGRDERRESEHNQKLAKINESLRLLQNPNSKTAIRLGIKHIER